MLSLQLLGERRLLLCGRDVSAAIHYRKGWALLAYLSVGHGRRHPREQIAELLWPNLQPTSARTNLRQVLADLNQTFDRHPGQGVLETTRDSVGVFPQEGVRIDLLALDAMQALPLEPDEAAIVAAEQHADQFGGEFMAGFSLPDCAQFEDWLENARRRLATVTVETLARLCRAQQVHGRVPQAIVSARQLVALDEWHEGHQRQLMRLLAAAGLHPQALDQYQALAASLAAELGTEPEPRTQALRAQVDADHRRAGIAATEGPPAARSLAAQVRRWLGELGGDASDVATGNEPALQTQRTLPVTGARPDRHAARGWLVVERGAGAGRRVAVAATPVLIGRSRDNELCIAHDTVSRQHCAVWHDEAGFRVRDLGSTNGTRVNDAIVQEAALSDGDRVVLGETVLRFGCGDQTHEDNTAR